MPTPRQIDALIHAFAIDHQARRTTTNPDEMPEAGPDVPHYSEDDDEAERVRTRLAAFGMQLAVSQRGDEWVAETRTRDPYWKTTSAPTRALAICEAVIEYYRT
jgi:hypothetical protein